MKRLIRHVWNNVLWLASARRFWSVVLTFVVTSMLCAVLPFKLETNVRWAGLVLQVFGLIVVMRGLVGRGKLFKVPNPVELAGKWWNARPRWKARSAQISGNVVATLSGSGLMTATGRTGLPPGATIEQRMELAEREIGDIYAKELPDIRKTQRESEHRVTAHVQQVEAAAERRTAEAEAKIRAATASDLPLEWVGVVLLFAGVVLSTIAPDAAGWFGAA